MVKITDLPSAQTPLDDADIMICMQNGILKQTTKGQISNLAVDNAILELDANLATIQTIAANLASITTLAAALPLDATAITFDPAGLSMLATNVQTAIAELKGIVADGAKGEITVSSNGSSWSVNAGLNATRIADGTVDNSEFQYLNGVTSNLQTQLNARQPLDATLTALAGLATGAGQVPYSTGTDTFAQLPLDTDGALTANSDARLATQKAVKTYADTKVLSSTAGISGASRVLNTMFLSQANYDAIPVPDANTLYIII